MTAYFYCCPQRLDVGSFVDPGEWGRILRTYDHQTFSDTWIILVRELVYEHVRREQFPTRPSRLDCLLLCMSGMIFRSSTQPRGAASIIVMRWNSLIHWLGATLAI